MSRSQFEPGKDDDADASHGLESLDGEGLDQRVREELPREPLDHLARRRFAAGLDRQLDPSPHPNRRDPLDAQVPEAAFDRTALGVEDAGLGRDVDREPERAQCDVLRGCDDVVVEVALEARAGDPLERLDVACARAGDDVRRQLRPGRRLVPRLRLEPVAHELLVEARLRAAGRVRRGVPEPRRVGRHHLVDQDQLAIDETHLELRVGEDDPGLRASRRTGFGTGGSPRPARARPAHGRRRRPASRRRSGGQSARSWTVDSKSMLMSCSPSSALVAGVRIGSGSRSLSRSPGGSGTPHTGAGVPVLAPAGAGEVAADDDLDREHRCPATDQHPALESRRIEAHRRRRRAGSPGPSRARGSGRCRVSRRTRSATGRSARGPCPGCRVGRITSNAEIRSEATSSNRSSSIAYRSRTLPDRMKRSAVSIGRDLSGAREQGVEARDHLGDVGQVQRIVEAGVEVGEAQRARDGRLEGEQLAQRAPLVGGGERGALDDRVRLLPGEARPARPARAGRATRRGARGRARCSRSIRSGRTTRSRTSPATFWSR